MEAFRSRAAVAAVAVAAGVWALGWGINFVALASSSPRAHSIVLLTTIVLSAAVALVGMRRVFSERTSQGRALLGAAVVGLFVAGLEFATLIAVALHALSQLDGS